MDCETQYFAAQEKQCSRRCPNDIILQIQKELEEETGKPVDKVVATLLWNKAYERGHAGGFYEIYAAIEDYEDLLTTVLKGGWLE